TRPNVDGLFAGWPVTRIWRPSGDQLTERPRSVPGSVMQLSDVEAPTWERHRSWSLPLPRTTASTRPAGAKVGSWNCTPARCRITLPGFPGTASTTSPLLMYAMWVPSALHVASLSPGFVPARGAGVPPLPFTDMRPVVVSNTSSGNPADTISWTLLPGGSFAPDGGRVRTSVPGLAELYCWTSTGSSFAAASAAAAAASGLPARFGTGAGLPPAAAVPPAAPAAAPPLAPCTTNTMTAEPGWAVLPAAGSLLPT